MSTHSPEERAHNPGTGRVKSPLDVMGGLFLLAIAALGLVGGLDLPFGTLSGIGSGLMPRVVSILVAALGVLLIVFGLLWEGDHLERWHVRGPLFVLGAVLVFAVVIRGSTLSLGGFAGIPELASFKVPPLGLVVAGPLTVIVCSLAASETRPVEIAVFSVVMTLLCGILFKELLNLPIPFDPAGLIPAAVNDTYEGAKAVLEHVVNGIKNVFIS